MSDVCSSCGSKGWSGTTVDGALSEGDSYYSRERYEDAKGAYQKALNILKEHGGCRSCKEAIERKISNC